MYICCDIHEFEKIDLRMEIVQDTVKNSETFEQLFHLYYQPLVVYANTILKDRDDAEDIVQQVFVNFWEKYEVLEVHTSERALLYKSVHNTCLNKLKHRKVRDEFAREHVFQGDSDDAVHLLEADELKEKIDAAIALLPEQCAKIFKMSRFEQLKYQEIADQLGLSVKTIENQMGKALKIIREELREYMHVFILLLTGHLL